MQWPITELVFPLFPTLLLLIKKRAAPDTHGLAISLIYDTDSISSMAGTKFHSTQDIGQWSFKITFCFLSTFLEHKR
jgi:hypothetical protein